MLMSLRARTNRLRPVRKLMNESHIRNVIEAALLAAGKPLQPAELVELFDEAARPQVQDIQAALAALMTEYSNRGIEIKETAAGFRIQVRREMANEISRLWPERPARYSRALLETLALIAYRQPITRAEIEAVRGVAVNPNILKTVIERNWVRVVGHRDVPGRPELLGTTRDFLDYFGLKNLDELPPLAELKVIGDIKVQFDLPDPGPALASDSNGAAGEPDAAPVEGAAVDATDTAAGVVDTALEVADAAAGVVDSAAEVADTADGEQLASHPQSLQSGSEGIDDPGATAPTQSDNGTDAEGVADGSPDGAIPASAIADRPAEGAVGDSADGAEVAAKGGEHKKSTATRRGAPDSALHEAEEFAASIDADLAAGDDDGSDDDELSAAGPGSSELVAGPRDIDH
jgi:segregation and condensation protein B